jgi:hypothetical protein
MMMISPCFIVTTCPLSNSTSISPDSTIEASNCLLVTVVRRAS